jgi:hypothetical protein
MHIEPSFRYKKPSVAMTGPTHNVISRILFNAQLFLVVYGYFVFIAISGGDEYNFDGIDVTLC